MSIQPWDIRIDQNRKEETLRTFIIFCEDQNDEPDYFRSFKNEKSLKVNVIENQKQGRLNLIKTLSYCWENGIVEFSESVFRKKKDVTEDIWCVYDRDVEDPDFSKVELHNDVDFSSAIQTAEHAGIKVAWSNDSFELWLLLHFEHVPADNKLHREYIYDRLTDIFRQLPDQTAELKSITEKQNFYYKTHLKRQKTFTPYVLPFLKNTALRNAAMERARHLAAAFEDSIPFHSRNPCTMVHLLVEELMKYTRYITE